MVKIQNKKAAIATLIIAVIFLVVLVALVLPSMREIKSLNSEIFVRRAELERLYRQGQSIRRVARDLEEVSPELSLIRESLPKKGEELAFITALEEISTRNRLESRLEFLSENDSPKLPGVGAVTVTITLGGTFQDVHEYLAELDKLPYYLVIQKFNFSNNELGFQPLRRGGVGGAPFTNQTTPQSSITAVLEALTYWRDI